MENLIFEISLKKHDRWEDWILSVNLFKRISFKLVFDEKLLRKLHLIRTPKPRELTPFLLPFHPRCITCRDTRGFAPHTQYHHSYTDSMPGCDFTSGCDSMLGWELHARSQRYINDYDNRRDAADQAFFMTL